MPGIVETIHEQHCTVLTERLTSQPLTGLQFAPTSTNEIPRPSALKRHSFRECLSLTHVVKVNPNKARASRDSFLNAHRLLLCTYCTHTS